MNGLRSKRDQISEVRSVQSESTKEATLVSNWSMGTNIAIVVLDDDDENDDEVVVSSSRTLAPARSAYSQQSGRDPVINEEDVELLLGFAVTTGTIKTSTDCNPRRKRSRVPVINTIDLCDESGEADQRCSKKVDVRSDEPKELKLTCAICMSTMDEETSTICGHIFCKKCITNAIQVQKKCPTCRKRLTMKNIHRIYLSSSTV
ncbi:hypothetical protein SUGI_1025810 [Cryptomeria japonica]|uniref:uncharacterized RING finger protein C548.05c n=1 Tax=Cryptomeria japonica TaxID=3369 RepID=UPI002414AC96|nr:uncharacterized RING finger protein C548.05c [Cryptomeria japonica]GLJ48627.1 hypothetical protein SUGI_1025810 [Cryptomeria japonica]